MTLLCWLATSVGHATIKTPVLYPHILPMATGYSTLDQLDNSLDHIHHLLEEMRQVSEQSAENIGKRGEMALHSFRRIHFNPLTLACYIAPLPLPQVGATKTMQEQA